MTPPEKAGFCLTLILTLPTLPKRVNGTFIPKNSDVKKGMKNPLDLMSSGFSLVSPAGFEPTTF